MEELYHFLFVKTWWRYEPTGDWAGQLYHWFNLLEGVAWIVIAALVLRRYFRHRHSLLEPLYALAFLTFGLSDFVEAYQLTTWLIFGKGLILFTILGLRHYLLRRYYPESRSF